MKTIFITLLQGVEAKNILRTPVLTELLKAPEIRLVFLVGSSERAEHYRSEFSDPRIIYEVAEWRPASWLDVFFGWLKFRLLRTKTTDLRRRMQLNRSGGWLAYWFGLAANRLLARPLVRKTVRWLDQRLVRDDQFGRFFDQYRPDAVLLAHLFDDREIALLREAKRRGVRTVGFVNSWDKLTARCIMRLLPDELLVYSDTVKAEAMAHADIQAERIRVVGIPQYDFYVGYRPTSREIFMARIGMDPAKKFFLYAPIGETFSDSDWEMINLLESWLDAGRLPHGLEMLVRFQPNDRVSEAELAKRPWLRYDRPGTRFARERGVDWDMSGEELRHLADTLSHMEFLVCYASSLSVDAAVFGQPMINIGFEVKPAASLAKSPVQFYHMEHYAKALASVGIRLVKGPDELLNWMKKYFAHPELDRAGRERLVCEQCGELDGRAGARIAAALTGQTPAS